MMMLRRPSSAARLSSRLGRTSLTSVSRRLSTAALNSDGPAIDLEEAAASILEDGFVVLPNLLDTDALAAVKDSIGAHTENILTSLADKGAELPVGSVHGFHECVLRSPKRFDMPFRIEAPAAVESIAQRVLLINEHATGATVCAFSGVVRAAPGCPAQLWHADSAHLVAEHAPPHLLNVLVALSDVSMADGPSEVLPGSHFLTNHHRAGCGFDADELVYQKETNTPATIGSVAASLPVPLSAGDAIIFDDRLLHRGGANLGEANRDLAFFSFCRASHVPNISTYYEATRSLSRYNHRALAPSVRASFPGLRTADASPPVLADGASGSQCHESVIAAVVEQMSLGCANAGGSYASSEAVDATVKAARAAMADFLHCAPDEVVFGPTMTALTYHLARSLRNSGRIGAGDNVVIDPLGHGANVWTWVQLAKACGAEVRWLPVAQDGAAPGVRALDCTLDPRPEALEGVVDERTRLLCMGVASNGHGSVHDVASLLANAKQRSGGSHLSFLDAVHYAPHAALDVGALGVDFLACSPYKFFGPHCGTLFGRRELLSTLPVDKLDCADEGLPSEANCWMSRFEIGTGNYEALAGTRAAVDYLAGLGVSFGGADADAPRRAQLEAAWRAIGAHEAELKQRFLEAASKVPGLSLLGVTDTSRLHARTTTFAVRKEGVSPADLAAFLCERGIWTTAGNHYAGFWTEHGGGLANVEEGMCRIGMLHYNTVDEVDRVISALKDA